MACRGHKNTYISEELECVGNGHSCSDGLEKVTIFNNAATIDNHICSDYKSLKEVTFQEGDGLKAIGTRCFAGSCLEEIVIPSGVTVLGNWAFYNCCSLKKVIF